MCECDKAAKAKGKSAKPPGKASGKPFGKAATKPPGKPKGKGKAGK